MEDNVYSYLAQGNYAGACSQYASDCDWITQRYVDGNPYDYYGVDPGYKPSFRPISIVIAIIVGALIALIVVSAMKGKHRSVIAKSEATSYMVPGSLNITGSRDTFLYHNVVAAPIPQNNGPRSGGGGGGSSTHVSSGGVSHGGSGGRGF